MTERMTEERIVQMERESSWSLYTSTESKLGRAHYLKEALEEIRAARANETRLEEALAASEKKVDSTQNEVVRWMRNTSKQKRRTLKAEKLSEARRVSAQAWRERWVSAQDESEERRLELEKCQWVRNMCPCCLRWESDGHATDCLLAALIATPEEGDMPHD